MRDTIQDSARNAAVHAHCQRADHLQMQAVAALVNDMNGWHCREQQQKCMAALQEIHEHLRAIEDEMPPLLTDVRPVLLEVAIGQPSVDYGTLLDETVHPNSVEVRRSLLQTAVDAVAFIEAIDEVPARKPAAGDTAESATPGVARRDSASSGSSTSSRHSRRPTTGSPPALARQAVTSGA